MIFDKEQLIVDERLIKYKSINGKKVYILITITNNISLNQ